MKRRIAERLLAVAAVAIAAMVSSLVTAVPAHASTGNFSGCGGRAFNNTNHAVQIANDWCWTYVSSEKFGTNLPCITNHNNKYAYNADMSLPAWGDSSWTTTY